MLALRVVAGIVAVVAWTGCAFDTQKFEDRACATDTDCRPDQSCISGLCAQRQCTTSADCSGGFQFTCTSEGLCMATSCTSDTSCDTGFGCVQGFCTEGCYDHDGDGFAAGTDCPGELDCNDNDPSVHPGATEGPFGHPTCNNNKDDDCNGAKDDQEKACRTACNNQLDDDGDGLVDGDDPGCLGDPERNSERCGYLEPGCPACDNAYDDDNDGTLDFSLDGTGDHGCASPADTSELSMTACNNDIDDDEDGFTDFRVDNTGDPGCMSEQQDSERCTPGPNCARCDNGFDDDNDGTIDYRRDALGDPGCKSVTQNSERCDVADGNCAACDNAVDDDNDGLLDFNLNIGIRDPGCTAPDDISEKCTPGAGCPACDNATDDDNDGTLDFRLDMTGDPGCASANDADEKGSTACDNGIDDDNDGRVDFNLTASLTDPGCASPAQTSERCTKGVGTCPDCDNGVDDDGDGYIDFNIAANVGDPGCLAAEGGPADTSEKCAAGQPGCPQCDDNVDNNSNGTCDASGCTIGTLTLALEPGCGGTPYGSDEGAPPGCNNGIDDDNDGMCDWNGCGSGPNALPPDPGCMGDRFKGTEKDASLTCDDGIDNDNDGRIDVNKTAALNDPGCMNDPSHVGEKCSPSEPGCPMCDDNIDNDNDGTKDYVQGGTGDPACASPAQNTEHSAALVCDNGLDDDGDGLVDFRLTGGDPGCKTLTQASERCAPSDMACAQCDNGVDDDNDGQSDYSTTLALRDPGCSGPSDITEKCLEAGCPQCDDGVDNDLDGRVDYNVNSNQSDPGCLASEGVSGIAASDPGERCNQATAGCPVCDNGFDDDGDTKLDYRTDMMGDPQCIGPTHYTEFANCVASIAGGSTHSCAVKSSGALWCWGDNSKGQFGTGNTTNSNFATHNTTIAGIHQVSAGNQFTIVRIGDGVWCSGVDGAGQCGQGGTAASRTSFVQVLASGTGTTKLANITQVSAGHAHVCARDGNARVWCWGEGGQGQLGNAMTTSSTRPSQVTGVGGNGNLSSIHSVAAGGVNNGGFSCAISAQGQGATYCWGHNGNGQLGDNSTTSKASPVQVLTSTATNSYLTQPQAIAAGGAHACAIRTNQGNVWCWGSNSSGQLGNNTTTQSLFAVQVTDGSAPFSGAIALSLGDSHSCALKADGTVWCWGLASSGQLGYGTPLANKLVPTQVQGGVGVNFRLAKGIGVGALHSCSFNDDETITCWGNNGNGRLGDGSTNNRSTPVVVNRAQNTKLGCP